MFNPLNKYMKTITLILGIVLASAGLAGTNPSLKNEIIEKVHPDLSEFNFDVHHENFVVVSFKIIDFQIEILDIQGSDPHLINMITLELSRLNIDKEYSEGDIYNYKFIFTKR